MKKTFSLLLALLLCLGAFSSLATEGTDDPDAVSSASAIYYEEASLDREGVLSLLQSGSVACSVATVNEDGSPNLAIFIPGVADEDHIVFGFAPNTTKDNLLRTKQAVVCCYLSNPDAEDKNERHGGARLVVELEEDEAVIQALRDSNERYTDAHVFLKIVEVLPIG